MSNDTQSISQTAGLRATPRQLSEQLGVSVLDVFAAIEAAKIEAHENEQGLLEYELEPVVSAVLEQKRLREEFENRNLKHLVKECLESYQDSMRQLIRDENKTAYQIKQMTESRFLEVLGQLSVSLGRVEAFLAQSSRILNQIDLRLARSSDPNTKQLVNEIKSSHEGMVSEFQSIAGIRRSASVIQNHVNQMYNDVPENLTLNDHWVAFEIYLTSFFSTDVLLSESARGEWFVRVRRVIGMGSLELRLNGEPLINEIRPALVNQFSDLVAGMPHDKDILPSFEKYLSWINSALDQGYPAILIYLLVILHRGVQISWSGFVSTFVSEG